MGTASVLADSFRSNSGKIVKPGMSKFDVLLHAGKPVWVNRNDFEPNGQSWYYIKGGRSQELRFEGNELREIRRGERTR